MIPTIISRIPDVINKYVISRVMFASVSYRYRIIRINHISTAFFAIVPAIKKVTPKANEKRMNDIKAKISNRRKKYYSRIQGYSAQTAKVGTQPVNEKPSETTAVKKCDPLWDFKQG
jgi:hypothetical protein